MTEPEKNEQKKGEQKRIRTVYSNIVRIGHSPYEFMLDFGQFQPEGSLIFQRILLCRWLIVWKDKKIYEERLEQN